MKRTRLRRVGRKRASVAKLDALLSQVVRERDGWRCRACGSTSKVAAAHIFPKGAYPALRHDPDNALTLCWSCHLGPLGWHKHPVKWGAWVREALGASAWAALELRARTATRPDAEGIRLQLERMLA